MKRIYVAGPYSADNVIDVLKNIGRGRHMCAILFEKGYAPFCPWHDSSYILDNPESEFDIKQFQEVSMRWLEVCDAVLVLTGWRGWEKSNGTAAEIRRAESLGIPVFYNNSDLYKWSK